MATIGSLGGGTSSSGGGGQSDSESEPSREMRSSRDDRQRKRNVGTLSASSAPAGSGDSTAESASGRASSGPTGGSTESGAVGTRQEDENPTASQDSSDGTSDVGGPANTSFDEDGDPEVSDTGEDPGDTPPAGGDTTSDVGGPANTSFDEDGDPVVSGTGESPGETPPAGETSTSDVGGPANTEFNAEGEPEVAGTDRAPGEMPPGEEIGQSPEPGSGTGGIIAQPGGTPRPPRDPDTELDREEFENTGEYVEARAERAFPTVSEGEIFTTRDGRFIEPRFTKRGARQAAASLLSGVPAKQIDLGERPVSGFTFDDVLAAAKDEQDDLVSNFEAYQDVGREMQSIAIENERIEAGNEVREPADSTAVESSPDGSGNGRESAGGAEPSDDVFSNESTDTFGADAPDLEAGPNQDVVQQESVTPSSVSNPGTPDIGSSPSGETVTGLAGVLNLDADTVRNLNSASEDVLDIVFTGEGYDEKGITGPELNLSAGFITPSPNVGTAVEDTNLITNEEDGQLNTAVTDELTESGGLLGEGQQQDLAERAENLEEEYQFVGNTFEDAATTLTGSEQAGEFAEGVGNVIGNLPANVNRAAIAAETGIEAAQNAPDVGIGRTLGATAEVTGRVTQRTIQQAQNRPYKFAGEVLGGAVLGTAAFKGIEKAGDISRSAKLSTKADVDLEDITNEAGVEGDLPQFDTDPNAPASEAVSEVEARAADNPETVTDAVDSDRALFHGTQDAFDTDLEVGEGASELPGLFTSPDASPIALESIGTGLPSPSLKPRLPKLSGKSDRFVGLPGDKIRAINSDATGAGYAVKQRDDVLDTGLRRGEAKSKAADIEDAEVAPDPTTSGYEFLTETAEAGAAFVRPAGGRTTELEAIFPPGSSFTKTGTIGVRVGRKQIPGTDIDIPLSGRKVPLDTFKRQSDVTDEAPADASLEGLSAGESAAIREISDDLDRLGSSDGSVATGGALTGGAAQVPETGGSERGSEETTGGEREFSEQRSDSSGFGDRFNEGDSFGGTTVPVLPDIVSLRTSVISERDGTQPGGTSSGSRPPESTGGFGTSSVDAPSTPPGSGQPPSSGNGTPPLSTPSRPPSSGGGDQGSFFGFDGLSPSPGGPSGPTDPPSSRPRDLDLDFESGDDSKKKQPFGFVSERFTVPVLSGFEFVTGQSLGESTGQTRDSSESSDGFDSRDGGRLDDFLF